MKSTKIFYFKIFTHALRGERMFVGGPLQLANTYATINVKVGYCHFNTDLPTIFPEDPKLLT